MYSTEFFRRNADTVSQSLSPGEILFREGDEAAEMFVLLEGIADIAVGKRVVETAMPGAMIGEMALIDNSPRAATVTAKTQCRLAKIDLERFQQLVKQDPMFAVQVMKALVGRVRNINRMLAEA